MTDAGYSMGRRKRKILDLLQLVLAPLSIREQIDAIAKWITLDTLEAMVATLEDERKTNAKR